MADKRRRWLWMGAIVLLAALGMASSYPRALALPGPTVANLGDQRHLGVGSCAGSTCHGRQEPTGVIVRQDELLRWQDPASPSGAHSRAWRVLGEARGQAIARKLGIGDAQTAAACLGCHADTSAGSTSRASLTDGVGCEGCHGGAAGWISSHAATGASHADNIRRGMVALDDPRTRASKCADCHFGSDSPGHFVDHRIMAAGHPRLSFELDLFSTLTQHWNEDADYRRRKGSPSTIRTWAIGQAVALSRALSTYSGPHGVAGAFPEFYFFDCHSCHRRISDDIDARPAALANPGRPLPPGTPPFQDENIIMLAAASNIAAPELAARFQRESRALHAAIAQGRPQAIAAATTLHATSDRLADAFAHARFDRAATLAIVGQVSSTAAERYTDYEASVQSVMAIDTLLSSLVRSGEVSGAAAARIRGDINRAYASVRDPNSFRPLDFRAAIARAGAAIRSLG